MRKHYYQRSDCRFCHSRTLKMLLDLGMQPSQGAYLTKDQLGEEKIYHLKLFKCSKCGLVQLSTVVLDELFQPYLSSVALSKHFSEFVDELVERFLKPGDFVVEFGSNDGVLLAPLQEKGMEVLGVEPDERIAKLALERKVPTIVAPFSDKVAKKINRKAELVLANNVFAHIDNMDEVMRGVDILLEDNGMFIFEVHNFLNILAGQYDNIYYEHLNYYTVSSLVPFLLKYGFEIIEVKPIPTHGGSMRVYAQKIDKKAISNLDKLMVENKKELVSYLEDLKVMGANIVGYGAAGRANTLLNYCKIDTGFLDYIVDESPSRYGKFTPGTHIPIVSPAVAKDLYQKDYILILAWNYQDQIMAKLKGFKGKFIIPLPKVQVI